MVPEVLKIGLIPNTNYPEGKFLPIHFFAFTSILATFTSFEIKRWYCLTNLGLEKRKNGIRQPKDNESYEKNVINRR